MFKLVEQSLNVWVIKLLVMWGIHLFMVLFFKLKSIGNETAHDVLYAV